MKGHPKKMSFIGDATRQEANWLEQIKLDCNN